MNFILFLSAYLPKEYEKALVTKKWDTEVCANCQILDCKEILWAKFEKFIFKSIEIWGKKWYNMYLCWTLLLFGCKKELFCVPGYMYRDACALKIKEHRKRRKCR